VLELVHELDSEAVARLLHALAEGTTTAPDAWSSREAAVLTREALNAAAAQLEDPAVPLPLI
jgi:hypothetical protein